MAPPLPKRARAPYSIPGHPDCAKEKKTKTGNWELALGNWQRRNDDDNLDRNNTKCRYHCLVPLSYIPFLIDGSAAPCAEDRPEVERLLKNW